MLFFRLSTLVTLVSDGLQMECSSDRERRDFGERLKTAIASFTIDFLPHMREEEEVRERLFHVCVCIRARYRRGNVHTMYNGQCIHVPTRVKGPR